VLENVEKLNDIDCEEYVLKIDKYLKSLVINYEKGQILRLKIITTQ
jgi:hypothetical protein